VNEVHTKERELQSEVGEKVAQTLPDVEVLAVELHGPDRLCVYVDRPTGVDHALCEEVTAVLREYLDRYGLEVSSPGFERPLRTRAHFERALGRRVSVRTAREQAGRKRFKGEVVRTGDREVTLAVANGEHVGVPYDDIVRGNLMDEGLRR
jgi:ribosome maturation factor RimP